MNQRRRIQLYEYVTAQGARGDESLAPSLLREGRAMLDALTEDFRSVRGVEVEVLDDIPARIDADWTLVIAPETGGILEAIARRVLTAGGRLLGPSPEAIRLTSDKLELAEHLRARGVPTPMTVLPFGGIDPTFPSVLKPRDGAGSQDTFLVRDQAELEQLLPTLAGEMIVQPFAAGRAASVAFLIGPNRMVSLLPCGQELSNDDRLHYLGGGLPLPEDLERRASELAQLAVRTVEGLFGYVGVDLVLGQNDVVIEINPRLTTSYLGLRQACRENLAGAMLRIAEGEECELSWDRTARRFAIG
jgi:tyramine---L-glutamate ligase